MKLILSLLLFLTSSLLANKQPNIVLIFADDMGYDDVGYHGNDRIRTPHIDSIAAQGVQFSQGYVSASVCGPSRAGLLTGVYQQRFGCGENPNGSGYPDKMKFPLAGLPTSQSMISEELKALGYTNGMIGKWHMGFDMSLRPNQRGYDFFYGFINGSHDYTEWTQEFATGKSRWPIFRNEEMEPANKATYLPVFKEKGVKVVDKNYLTDLFTDEAVNFIDRNAEKPFFLYLAYNAVHHPWQTTQHALDKTSHLKDDKDYHVFASMVYAMDEGIGKVMDKLKEKGIEDNTIVIFLTDNGSPQGQGIVHSAKDPNRHRGGSTMSSTGIFRGYKGDTYEGGIRVPFCIKWPNKIKTNSKYELQVSSLDLQPTLIKAAGGNDKTPIKGFPYDGVDILPYINGTKGEEEPHRSLFWRRDTDYAIRKGDWKLQWNDAHGPLTITLFNIKDDPEERKNLVKQHPELAQQLQNEFDAWDNSLPDNEWWGGPWNRLRHTKTKEINVAKFNQNPPTQQNARRKIRK
jgi:arylsulfatase A-like enzyme